MSKKAVLMMTFGSPEAISYEAVAEFLPIFVGAFVQKKMKSKPYTIIMFGLGVRLYKPLLGKK